MRQKTETCQTSLEVMREPWLGKVDHQLRATGNSWDATSENDLAEGLGVGPVIASPRHLLPEPPALYYSTLSGHRMSPASSRDEKAAYGCHSLADTERYDELL